MRTSRSREEVARRDKASGQQGGSQTDLGFRCVRSTSCDGVSSGVLTPAQGTPASRSSAPDGPWAGSPGGSAGALRASEEGEAGPPGDGRQAGRAGRPAFAGRVGAAQVPHGEGRRARPPPPAKPLRWPRPQRPPSAGVCLCSFRTGFRLITMIRTPLYFLVPICSNIYLFTFKKDMKQWLHSVKFREQVPLLPEDGPCSSLGAEILGPDLEPAGGEGPRCRPRRHRRPARGLRFWRVRPLGDQGGGRSDLGHFQVKRVGCEGASWPGSAAGENPARPGHVASLRTPPGSVRPPGEMPVPAAPADASRL